MASQEVSILTNEDALASIRSFDDALAVLSDSGVLPVSSDDLGTGFVVLPTREKRTLVDVPFVILAYEFHTSKDYSDENGDPLPFAAMHIVTQDGRKLIVTDGSTGIMRDLRRFESKGRRTGIIAERGLTASEYQYVAPDGSRSNAVTYYIA